MRRKASQEVQMAQKEQIGRALKLSDMDFVCLLFLIPIMCRDKDKFFQRMVVRSRHFREV